uniref:Uncharacterized protein n=1 Tax=Apteryx owenii TaxID=8824 RepID=A0A8B9QD04_APTOW
NNNEPLCWSVCLSVVPSVGGCLSVCIAQRGSCQSQGVCQCVPIGWCVLLSQRVPVSVCQSGGCLSVCVSQSEGVCQSVCVSRYVPVSRCVPVRGCLSVGVCLSGGACQLVSACMHS